MKKIVLILLLIANIALADGYKIRQSVINTGGKSSGGSYVLYGSMEQQMVGFSTGGSYQLSSGFWKGWSSLVFDKPVVSTTAASDKTGTSATLAGNITAIGGALVSERGVIYGTSPGLSTSVGTKEIVAGTSAGTYSKSISGLSPETQYYHVAYAINSLGTGYGTELSFYTVSTEPNSQPTLSASPSGNTSVVLSFPAANTILNNDGYILLRRTDNSSVISEIIDGTGPESLTFASTVKVTTITNSALTTYTDNTVLANTQYYYTLIPYNNDGTHTPTTNYKTDGTLATANAITGLPVLTTGTANSISTSALTVNTNNVSNSGSALTARGVVYGTSANPTIGASNFTSDGTSTGNYNSTVSGLNAETNYYLRAYATNSAGTAFGSDINFYTLSLEPSSHPNLSSSVSGSTSALLSFDAASTITNADGYILVRRTDNNSVSSIFVDGVAPNSLTFGTSTLVTNVSSTATTSYDNTGLTINTTYYYTLVPYSWDGVNAATYNYKTDGTLATTNVTPQAAPVVNSVSVPSNGTYGVGQNLDFTVVFDKIVNVIGTPRISLTIGSSSLNANYVSGSTTTSLLFRYTVQANDLDNNGIAVGTLTLNSGSIKSNVNLDANLTLNSVGSTASVNVDAVAPLVSSINRANSSPTNSTSVDYTVVFSKTVTGVDVGDFSLTTSGTSGTISGISGSGTTYTVTVSSITGDGTIRLDLKSSGTGIQDAYSNPIGSGFTSGQSYTIDNTAPIVNSVSVPADDTYIFDENLDFTVHYSEAVTVVGSPYITITLNSGSVNATYLSGSGTANLLFRYAVSNNDNDKDGISVASFNLNSATIKDAVNNNANNTLNSVASTSLVFVDALAPHVTSVAMPSNGTYGTGQSLNFTVNFDEAVNIAGSPYITVNVGGSNKNATYSSGTGTSAIVFSYTVVTNDIDVDGIVVSGSINLNSGTVKDLATNNATLTLNSIGSGTSVLVDGVGPTITSVSKPSDGTYITDQNLDFTVNFNESTIVTGTPRILITIGSTAKYANYVSGSGTSNLVFRYTIESGLVDNNGIVISSPIELNGGTLKDQYDNSATLTFTSPNTDGILVDASTPTITLGSLSSRTVNSIDVTSNNVTASSSTVSEKGIVYGTSTSPTISGSKVANATAGLGTYDITLSSLNPETLYYIRAYATNTAGTGYSSETSAYTLSTEPTGHSSLTASAGQTNIVLNFQAASTFGADGYILLRKQSVTYPDATNVNDGSAPVDLSLPNGTVLAATITSNSQTSYDDTGLTPANSLFSYVLIPFNWDASHTATYNYRTSATIPTASATTGIPVVSTGTKTNYAPTSITITGSNVTSQGGANVTDRGVVWSTSPNPTIANNKTATNPNPSSGTGTYDVNITGMTASTKYYARAYATSSIATSYGSEITFYTAPATQASNITWGSVTQTSITANWTSGSGANRLVLIKKTTPISTTPLTNETEYTASSAYASGSSVDGGYVIYHGNGSSAPVTGLTRNTLYYFRVFESVGSGSEVVFNQNTATTNPTSRNTNRKTGAEGGDVFDFDILTISPNPASDYIKIDFTLPEEIALNMQIFDLQGNTMFTLNDPNRFTRGHNHQTIDCSNFPSGTYFISMTNGSEAFYYSFVVER